MSPIVIFAYSRPDATQRLLTSLLRCPECADSELYVFVDGPKTKDAESKVQATIKVVDGIDTFKKVHRHYSEVNKGLSRSVIEGVTYVMERHDKVIVLEDDLLVAPDFLTFMNEALDIYEDRKDIWSVSGYTPRLQGKTNHPLTLPDPPSVFLVPRAQSWGYATWRDRWQRVDWNVKDFQVLRNRKQRIAFNQGGNDLYRLLDMQVHGKIESWAIRFAFAGFLAKAWTVNPMASKVKIQQAESTTDHQGWHDSRHDVDLYDGRICLNPQVAPDNEWQEAFRRHHDLGVISKMGYFMRRHDLGYHQMKKILSLIKR